MAAKTVSSSLFREKDNFARWLTVIIVIIVVVIIWRVIKMFGDSIQDVSSIAQTKHIENQTGINAARQGQIRSIAEEAHLAIWGEKTWFGNYDGQWYEDEDKFISSLNMLSTAEEVYLFNDYYKSIGGKSARNDMNQYLSASQKARIKSIVSQNLA